MKTSHYGSLPKIDVTVLSRCLKICLCLTNEMLLMINTSLYATDVMPADTFHCLFLSVSPTSRKLTVRLIQTGVFRQRFRNVGYDLPAHPHVCCLSPLAGTDSRQLNLAVSACVCAVEELAGPVWHCHPVTLQCRRGRGGTRPVGAG